MADVDVDNASFKLVSGMLTHIAFFVGELNFALGTTHFMNTIGFVPALAVAPEIT